VDYANRRMVSRTARGCQGLFAVVLIACATLSPALEEQMGVIQRVGAFGYAIVPDRDPGTRYAPNRLPREFEVDGMRVIFSGTEMAPPPGARLWGTPFHLVSIRRAPAR
jgi:hypothetical protein